MPQRYALANHGAPQSFAEGDHGALLVAAIGLKRFQAGKLDTIPLPAAPDTMHNIFVDRDGGNWIGTSRTGLMHWHQGHLDTFSASDGLSGNNVIRIFEDREGNLWVSTDGGLDRFRVLPATTYSVRQGIQGSPSAVLADPDGGIWVGGIEAVYRWQHGNVTALRPPPDKMASRLQPGDTIVPGMPRNLFASLLRDHSGRVWIGAISGLGYFRDAHFTPVPGLPDGLIDSLAEDGDGAIWIAHRRGLFRISKHLVVEPIRIPTFGDRRILRVASDPAHGGIWVGFSDGGVAHLLDGSVTATYGPKEGFGNGVILEIRVTHDGTVWVARDAGLTRIKDGRITNLDSKSGLPCDGVHASIADEPGAFWIYTVCGLARISAAEMDAWIAAADRHERLPVLHPLVLDDADGVASYSSPGSTAAPHLAQAPDRKLWFIAPDGVTVVDPRHLATNKLPPPVQIEQITADDKAYDPRPGLVLPPLTRNLAIDFTALSLVAPEKMRFRYQLEGQDKDWREVTNTRSVQYSNLSPGDYRFRVIASNNSGVWNNTGASLAFSVAPAYWQTDWFVVLCVVASLGFLAMIFQWRINSAAAAVARDRDIARRQHEARVELAHANRLATMGQLTASLAHEVNQPLGAVLMNAQAAMRWLSEPLQNTEEARTNLGRIVRDVGRASGIVKRVRAMAKKAPEDWEDVNVNEAAAEVIALTAGEAAKNQISVREDFAAGLPAVRADRIELQQVILNLLMNAIEAVSAARIAPSDIIVQTVLTDVNEVQVSVRDFGPGIAPDALERIFQPFYTSKDSGLGMGLSICRTIIEAHDGRLWAEANYPNGAVFTFTLPVTPPANAGQDKGTGDTKV
jgi:signal transduction histidine kinase/ligand-binding sensor domain-containing protein